MRSGLDISVPSQQRGGLAGASQRWWRFAPQFFALQTDRLGHHQGRGREVMGGRLLLMSTVDVTGDEEGDLSDLLMKQNSDVSACLLTVHSLINPYYILLFVDNIMISS